MRKRLVLARTMILLLGAAPVPMALAQTARETSFAQADANHDGHISLDEFETFVKQRMASSDTMRAHMFQQLSPEDQEARLKTRFTSMDAGNKGYLEMADWKQQ